MLDVFFTVDVEIWCDGWTDIDRKFSSAFNRYVYGPTSRGSFGLPYQLELLKDYGIHGAFFVEPLFSTRFGSQPLEEIVGLISAYGQEVQLHMHTEWVDESKEPLLDNSQTKRQYLFCFSLEEQKHLIAVGAALLRKAGASEVNAFRAGGFGFNIDTLRALAANGIAFDSSYNAAMFGLTSGVMPGVTVVEPIECEGVFEYPMTVFSAGMGSLRHVQLSACSYGEIEWLLWQALEAERNSFVILFHNFELLNSSKNRPDEIVVKRFKKLCSFLDQNRDSFHARGFRGADAERRAEAARATHGDAMEVMHKNTRASLSPDVSMSHWELRKVPFKYQLSDWTILGLPLQLQCRSVNLLEESPPLVALTAPFEELIEGSQGFMIRALPVIGDLPSLGQYEGYLRYVPLQYQHCYIDLTLSFDSYQRKFSSKTRSTISRKVKKYLEYCGGFIPWRTYREPTEMRDFFRLARGVSKLSYQERLLDAGIPESEGFIRHAESLAAKNRVRAYILFDGERPVSYLYCPVNESVLIYAYLGYDPKYRKMSVGTVLQWLALEQLFGEGCFRAFDFTEGQSDHKRLFATHQRQCANVFLVKNSLKNKAIIYSHFFLNRFFGWLGARLDQLGVKAKIKGLLRFSGKKVT